MTKVLFNGKVVKVMKTSNKGSMKGYCGQELKSGKFAVYVEDIGICSVVKGKAPEEVEITGVIVPAEIIVNAILDDFRHGKKLAVMVESPTDKSVLKVLEIPVNKRTISMIMSCLSLNTTTKKVGVVIRNVNDIIDKLATVGNTVLEFPSSRLEEIKAEYEKTGSNNGNFAEYLLSGDEKDIFDRFRPKKNDVIIKLDAFKSKRRWELKTTLKYVNKSKKSSASNTNMLYSISNK